MSTPYYIADEIEHLKTKLKPSRESEDFCYDPNAVKNLINIVENQLKTINILVDMLVDNCSRRQG